MPVDLDIDADKDELFVANFGSTQIPVVDLVKQDIGRTLFVDTGQGTWDVVLRVVGRDQGMASTQPGTASHVSTLTCEQSGKLPLHPGPQWHSNVSASQPACVVA